MTDKLNLEIEELSDKRDALADSLLVAEREHEVKLTELHSQESVLADSIKVATQRYEELVSKREEVEAELAIGRKQLENERQEFDVYVSGKQAEIAETESGYQFLTEKLKADALVVGVRSSESKTRVVNLNNKESELGARLSEVVAREAALEAKQVELDRGVASVALQRSELTKAEAGLQEDIQQFNNKQTEFASTVSDFNMRATARDSDVETIKKQHITQQQNLDKLETELQKREALVDVAVPKQVVETFYIEQAGFEAKCVLWDKEQSVREALVKKLETKMENLKTQESDTRDSLIKRDCVLVEREKAVADKETSLEAAQKDLEYQKALFRTKVREAKMEEVINAS